MRQQALCIFRCIRKKEDLQKIRRYNFGVIDDVQLSLSGYLL
jgi:hypothetical protein